MKTLFTISMIVALVFGLGFVFIPDILLSTYGITNNPAANALIRNSGTSLLAFGVLFWFARQSTRSELHKVVLKTMFVYWLLSSITILIGQLTIFHTFMGWATVALHVTFLIVFGIFLSKK